VLSRYVGHFDPEFTGVTGGSAALDAFTRSLGVAVIVGAPGEDGSYTVDHSAAVFLVDPQADRWFRYDAVSHALNEVITGLDPRPVWADMQRVLPAPSATLLILAAEPGRTSAKYEAAASLVWRDAGVLLGFLAVAAEALGLNYCPLGVTGDSWVKRLLDQPGLAGVGAAFVGAAAN